MIIDGQDIFPQHLAEYSDIVLKQGSNDPAQTKKKFEDINKILDHIFSKDIFIKEYEIVNYCFFIL